MIKKSICFLVAAAISGSVFGQSFWVSARGIGGAPPHMIHEFDMSGVYTGVSVDQVPGAQSSSWGYRDGAVDRAGNLYFGWEGGIARHNPDGSGGTQIITGGIPGIHATWHGLAFDPTGDGGNGSLWGANMVFADLVEVDLSGNVLSSYNVQGGEDLYGLSYDDSDGNLWGHIHGMFSGFNGDVIKINVTTNPGTRMSGAGWSCGFPAINHGGGLTGFHDGSGRLAAINVATPDELGVYDSTGTMVAGPWDLQAQTNIIGHLGVAVTAGDPCAGQLCGDANCDGQFNGADIDPFFLGLGDPAAWETQYPNCDLVCVADINYDGAVNGADIDPFFVALGLGYCP